MVRLAFLGDFLDLCTMQKVYVLLKYIGENAESSRGGGGGPGSCDR